MNKPIELTQQDQEMLTRIDRALRGESRLPSGSNSRGSDRQGLDGRDGFCGLLAATIPHADPTFERQLEARLVNRLQPETERAAARKPARFRGWFAPRRHRGLALATAVLLIVAVALIAVGPRRAWAQFQQWLGYVPGVGFVDLEETRVLTAPVAVTRDDVTLTVEQVLAQPDKTAVVISSRGLPPEDQVWPDGAEMEPESEPLLQLPDGTAMAPETFTLHWGGGTLIYPPLPPDVYRVALLLPRLPLVPAEIAAEDWSVPLALRPATGDLVADLFPQPYSPPDVADTHFGVTLRLLEVAHSPDQTALRLQLEWTDPMWETHFIRGFDLPRLTDDLGHTYFEYVGGTQSGSLSQSVVVGLQHEDDATPAPSVDLPSIERTLTFSAVSPAARRLTLTMGGLDFGVPATGHIPLDLGGDPQVGDTWPLDLPLEVAGIPVRIIGARLVEEEVGRPEGAESRTILWFDVDATEQDGEIGLCGLRLDGRAAGFRSGSLGGYDSQSRQVRAGLEATSLPTGPIDVRIDGATLCLNTTWTLSWEVPKVAAEDEAITAPVTLHPTDAAQTRNGLTLAVEEAVLTDRLTAVRLGLANPPEGVTLHAALRWAWPDTRPKGLALTDDRGHSYAPSQNVAWLSHNTPDPDLTALSFEPLQPLARQLTLEIPAVAVIEPEIAAFDVTVPEGLELELMPGTDDRPWAATTPWSVDIPLVIADYELHFAQARLEELNGGTLLTLVSEPYQPIEKTRWLSGFELATVTMPDGRPASLVRAMSSAGPEDPEAGPHQAMLAFDVTDPETLRVQPGTYHVEIDGVRTLVQGPWRLTWDVP